MKIRVTQEQGQVPVKVFHLQGQLNLGTAATLEQAAQDAHAAGMRDLLIDMSAVSSLTSAGLRAIHAVYRLLSNSPEAPVESGEPSPHLKLLNPSAELRRVLKISGFDLFIEIHDDPQTAIASFG